MSDDLTAINARDVTKEYPESRDVCHYVQLFGNAPGVGIRIHQGMRACSGQDSPNSWGAPFQSSKSQVVRGWR